MNKLRCYTLPLSQDVTNSFWLKCIRAYIEETRLESSSYYGQGVLEKKLCAKLISK